MLFTAKTKPEMHNPRQSQLQRSKCLFTCSTKYASGYEKCQILDKNNLNGIFRVCLCVLARLARSQQAAMPISCGTPIAKLYNIFIGLCGGNDYKARLYLGDPRKKN